MVERSREPRIEVPLPAYMEQVAQRAAELAIEKHAENCPIKELEPRVRKLELKFSTLVGAMVGAGSGGGMVGGGVVVGLMKMMGM